jgi:hypothetical protein
MNADKRRLKTKRFIRVHPRSSAAESDSSRLPRERKSRRSGQATIEFALLYAGVVLPLTFMTVFVSEMLWVWHSVTEFTRDGARYAATHCWQADAGNVIQYMQTHVPRMIDMDQFQSGAAGIEVRYFSRDPDSGNLNDFSCDGGECTVNCIPDTVSVRITNYQFVRFSSYMRLPPVTIPDFRTSIAVGSGGCDEGGACSP